jgi:hypothetical protein
MKQFAKRLATVLIMPYFPSAKLYSPDILYARIFELNEYVAGAAKKMMLKSDPMINNTSKK